MRAITEPEVRQLASSWYAMLDEHVDVEQCAELLAPDVKFHLPEGVVRGLDAFREWYLSAIRTFFDEVHAVKLLQVTVKGDSADVAVIVNWQASVWKPPAATSERIVVDATQRWVVVRSPQTAKPVISDYVVESLDYHPGSARL
jgi:SnoaL-like domain